MTLFTSVPRKALLAFALIGSAAFGASVLAHSPSDAHAMQAGADGAQGIVAHVNNMLQYVYTEAGATDAQKTQLTAITQQAQTDLAQIQNQGGEGHARIFGLLTQPTIDRSAVEAEYAAHMKIHEQVSKRTLQFLLDVAEALTPAQRKALADHVAQHAAHAG
ncbi:MAG: periplasmic heavy metal sensor [Proteobacteria bacterium]|nr:periplasmic heavy metal sensor [Pseudomonadota bacterium]